MPYGGYNIPTMKIWNAKELIREIKKDGWYRVSAEGGHLQFKHPTKPGKVTIPNHKGDMTKRVAKNVLKQAGLEKYLN